MTHGERATKFIERVNHITEYEEVLVILTNEFEEVEKESFSKHRDMIANKFFRDAENIRDTSAQGKTEDGRVIVSPLVAQMIHSLVNFGQTILEIGEQPKLPVEEAPKTEEKEQLWKSKSVPSPSSSLSPEGLSESSSHKHFTS
jgi:hypothetical protein